MLITLGVLLLDDVREICLLGSPNSHCGLMLGNSKKMSLPEILMFYSKKKKLLVSSIVFSPLKKLYSFGVNLVSTFIFSLLAAKCSYLFD